MSNWGVCPIHRYKEKTFFFQIENAYNINSYKCADKELAV